MPTAERLYASPRDVAGLEECDFYHVIDLPGVGTVGGDWDLRGGEDAYLGGIDVAAKRVLEIGPASGFLTMHLESAGAEVVAVDLGSEDEWDVVPQRAIDLDAIRTELTDRMERLRNSFWYTHRAFGSASRVHYGSAYALPRELGRFDIATLGCVLLHTRNPLLILQRCAELVDDALVIVDRHVAELDGAPVCRLEPSADNQVWSTWWSFSPDLLVQFAALVGFPNAEVTFHQQMRRPEPESTDAVPIDLFSIVARR